MPSYKPQRADPSISFNIQNDFIFRAKRNDFILTILILALFLKARPTESSTYLPQQNIMAKI